MGPKEMANCSLLRLDLLSIANDMVQSTFIFGSASDGEGGGEYGFDDGSVEVHHCCLRQVKLLQLPQEVHPLMSFVDQRVNVQRPLEVLGDDSSQEVERVHSIDRGVTQYDGVVWRWVLP